jgi:hypothetical protein
MSTVKVAQASCAVAALLALPVLVSLVLGGPDRIPTGIQEYAAINGSILQLGLATCDGNADLKELAETPSEVRLLVIADEPSRDSNGCSDGMEVPLSAPLGTRDVIDASTGQPVAPRPE